MPSQPASEGSLAAGEGRAQGRGGGSGRRGARRATRPATRCDTTRTRAESENLCFVHLHLPPLASLISRSYTLLPHTRLFFLFASQKSPRLLPEMDLQTLSNLFASTYSPDPNVQKSGELQIRKVRRWITRPPSHEMKSFSPGRRPGGHGHSHPADHRQR